MRLNRVYSPGPLIEGGELALTASAANHVARVLRLRVGDAIGVFDGNNGEYLAIIASIKGQRVTVNVGEAVAANNESHLEVKLTQGISRGERMDWVVQKATELGVAAVTPVITLRSVVKLDHKQAAKKQEHWRNIMIAACEQCGRARIPEIMMPISFADHLKNANADAMRFILDPTATNSLTTVELRKTKLEILIGPEGGFDDNEIAAANQAGFMSVKLGPRILRTETAAVAALAVLQAKWGDLR